MALAALARRLYAGRAAAHRPAARARHPRRVAVLRRLADHPGDQRAVRGRGPAGRRTRRSATSSSRSPRSSSPLPLRRAALRHRQGRRALRAGHACCGSRALAVGRARPGSCAHPEVLKGLSPTYAVAVRRRPPRASRSWRWAPSCWSSPAPRRSTPTWATSAGRRSGAAWFFVVFPALTLNYLGQAALILRHPAARSNPFFLLLPELGAAADGGAGHRGDGDRQPGGHLRRLLAVPAGDAARAAAAGDRPADLRARGRPDLPARRQRRPVRRRAGGDADVPVRPSGWRRRTACPSPARSLVDTMLLLLVARVLWQLAAVEARARRRGLRRRGGSPSWRRTCPRSPTAAGCRCSSRWCVFTVMTTWRRGREIVSAQPAAAGGLAAGVRRRRSTSAACRGCPARRSSPTRARTPPRWRCGPTSSTTRSCTRTCSSCRPARPTCPHVPVAERVHGRRPRLRGRPHPAPVGPLRLLRRAGPARGAARRRARRGAPRPGTDRRRRRVVLPVPRGRSAARAAPGMARGARSLFLGLAHNAADPAAYFGLPADRTVTMGSDVKI